MKICAVQSKPVKGDIETNIINHKKLIDLAVADKADIIIFPELSVTGYEPTLAKELATHISDSRLDDFQNCSDAKRITIGVGMPIKNNGGISISMVLFQPHKARTVYSKKYLHADEEPYFISGQSSVGLANNNIALAICYELSVPAHSEVAFKEGAEIYIASVAKSVAGVEKAGESLSYIAHKYSMTVLMSNSIGHCDNFDCGGKTSAWNNKGVLLGQLNDQNEGILILDTNTGAIIKKMI
jgi:predicted amidohydrolase